MKRVLILAALFGLIGGLAGLYAPRESEATVINYDLRVNPGATSTLNCGYHTGPCEYPYPVGPALDWANSAGATIYWRSYGWCSILPCTTIATGTISSFLDQCYKVRVSITSTVPAGASQGSVDYTHSTTSYSGTQFNINGGNYVWTGRSVGTTRSQDASGCPGWLDTNGDTIPDYWPAHLHQTRNGTNWYNNSNYPNAPGTGSGYPITTNGWYQSRHGWYISF
jgi:hypothetical protein